MPSWAELPNRPLNPLPATDAVFWVGVEHHELVSVVVVLAGKSPEQGFTIRLVQN